MMWNFIHDILAECIEDMYIQSFVIDRLITATEDFLEEEHVKHDYDPRKNVERYQFTFVLNDNEYHADFTNSINGMKVRIHSIHLQQLVYNYEIIYNPNNVDDTSFKWLHKNADKNKYNNLAATKEFVPEKDYSFFEKYTKVIDEIVEKKKEIQELFKVRTNPGQPTASTYVIDDFVHKLEMELSWMKAKKYVSEKISMDELIRLEDEDLNYNKTIYRFEDRSPAILARFYARVKDHWMFGKRYRIENINMNGLFYIENMDLQDISECGYDTIENLIDEGYKVVEIVEVNEDGTSDKTSN
jgi:hypothetical protein